MGSLAVEAAKAGDIQTAYNKTVDNSYSVLKQMQTETLGTIDKFKLMAVANSAVNRGIKSESLPTIAAFAQRLADADPQFRDVIGSMNDLTTAIATGRTMTLARMGIDIDAKTINEEYAKSIGKEVDALTEQEKQAALTNDIMSKLQEKMKTMAAPTIDAADKMAILNAKFIEAKVEIGTALEPAFTSLVDAILPMIPTISTIITDLLPVMNALLWVTKEVLFFLSQGLDAVKTGFEGWAWIIGVVIDAVKELVSWIKSALDWINKLLSPLNKVSNGLTGLTGGKAVTTANIMSGSKKVNDAIISPDGRIITTHPDDYLIATKNPGGMGGMTIYIENVYGMNPRELSRALKNELATKISI